MNYIVKKVCVSMATGAGYMIGSWVAKYTLDKLNKKIQQEQKQKEVSPA